MTHDPLCPCASHPKFCEGCTPQCGTCQCDLIAKVRADQKRADAQEVKRHKQRGYTCDCGGDVNDYEHHLYRSIIGVT